MEGGAQVVGELFAMSYYRTWKAEPEALPRYYLPSAAVTRAYEAPIGATAERSEANTAERCRLLLHQAHAAGPRVERVICHSVEAQPLPSLQQQTQLLVQITGSVHYVNKTAKSFAQSVLLVAQPAGEGYDVAADILVWRLDKASGDSSQQITTPQVQQQQQQHSVPAPATQQPQPPLTQPDPQAPPAAPSTSAPRLNENGSNVWKTTTAVKAAGSAAGTTPTTTTSGINPAKYQAGSYAAKLLSSGLPVTNGPVGFAVPPQSTTTTTNTITTNNNIGQKNRSMYTKKRLWVRVLPAGMTTDEIKDKIAQLLTERGADKVAPIRVDRPAGQSYGYIDFPSEETAELIRKQGLVINGQTLHCEFATVRGQRGRGNRQQPQ